MIEIRFSGATPEALFTELADFVQVLHAGQPMVVPASPGGEVSDATQSPSGPDVGAVAEENPPVVPEKKKPGRPRKDVAPATIEAKAEPVKVSLAEALEPTTKPAAPITLDTIRERVKDIISAHRERGNEMPAVTAYVLDLFKPFDIKKGADLAEAKWAEFMTASQGYLDGTKVVETASAAA